jgi:hypothetical protein
VAERLGVPETLEGIKNFDANSPDPSKIGRIDGHHHKLI